jgi:surface protein
VVDRPAYHCVSEPQESSRDAMMAFICNDDLLSLLFVEWVDPKTCLAVMSVSRRFYALYRLRVPGPVTSSVTRHCDRFELVKWAVDMGMPPPFAFRLAAEREDSDCLWWLRSRNLHMVRSDLDIYEAVNLWLSDKSQALVQYGHISLWNVSSVTNMHFLFSGARRFCEDLSEWDVSAVTDMCSMFENAVSFSSDLSGWVVQSVRDMSCMFNNARCFSSNLSQWDVSSVVEMSSMFEGSESFSSDLSGWDVSSVVDFRYMLSGAKSFSCDLRGWNMVSAMYVGGLIDPDADVEPPILQS